MIETFVDEKRVPERRVPSLGWIARVGCTRFCRSALRCVSQEVAQGSHPKTIFGRCTLAIQPASYLSSPRAIYAIAAKYPVKLCSMMERDRYGGSMVEENDFFDDLVNTLGSEMRCGGPAYGSLCHESMEAFLSTPPSSHHNGKAGQIKKKCSVYCLHQGAFHRK